MMNLNLQRKPITKDMLPPSGNPRYKSRVIFCEMCDIPFIPRSPRTRFCDNCRLEHEREMAHKRYLRNGQTSAHRWKYINGRKVYVPVGSYNQKGENNNAYKNGSGIDWYSRAIEVLPEKCNRCGATNEENLNKGKSNIRYLLLHHKDGNHSNNSPENWEILCKRCHQKHHSVRSADGRFVSNKG